MTQQPPQPAGRATLPRESEASSRPRRSAHTPAAGGGKWIRNSTRWAIYYRDDFACMYCGEVGNLSIDHVRSVEAGGTNDPTNLVTCCLSCNSSKQGIGNVKWYRRLRARGIDTDKMRYRITRKLSKPLDRERGRLLASTRSAMYKDEERVPRGLISELVSWVADSAEEHYQPASAVAAALTTMAEAHGVPPQLLLRELDEPAPDPFPPSPELVWFYHIMRQTAVGPEWFIGSDPSPPWRTTYVATEAIHFKSYDRACDVYHALLEAGVSDLTLRPVSIPKADFSKYSRLDIEEQEVLGPDVPMDDPELVPEPQEPQETSAEVACLALATVLPPRYIPPPWVVCGWSTASRSNCVSWAENALRARISGHAEPEAPLDVREYLHWGYGTVIVGCECSGSLDPFTFRTAGGTRYTVTARGAVTRYPGYHHPGRPNDEHYQAADLAEAIDWILKQQGEA